jgi:4-amino-4-deoxy-L-arabinose transferase-like glycosyltransferase
MQMFSPDTSPHLQPHSQPLRLADIAAQSEDRQFRFGKMLWAILIVALAVRLLYSLAVARGLLDIKPELESTDGYHLIAQSMLDGHGYRFGTGEAPTLRRAPAYPAFLATMLAVSGGSYVWVQVAQAALGSLSCWLLFLLGRWVLSARLGLVAAAMFAVYPNSILYSARLYAENLYFPAFLGFAYLMCRASYEGSSTRGLGAGLLWGVGMLTRGTLLPLPAALPLGIAISSWHRSPATRWIRWAIPALLGGALVLAPWAARNYSLTGQFVPVSSWGWAPIFHGLQVSQHANEWRDLSVVDAEAGQQIRDVAALELRRTTGSIFQSPGDEIRYDQIARSMTMDQWARDPLLAVSYGVRGMLYSWFFAFGPATRIVSMVVHLPLLALFVWGTIAMSKRQPQAFVRAFYALAYPHVRYMAPAVALSFVFSALPILMLLKRFRLSGST